MDQGWRTRAACLDRNPEWWSPPGHPRSHNYQRHAAPARAVCDNVCPVRGECLAWALRTGEAYGVWGGKDPVQREALRLLVVRYRAA